ncbi:MAG: family ATPase [Clostridia bacterium]|jgi:predicted ATP-binding protein involved in virulence|nr:family ATPase [Clostridia bacterium]
MRIVKIKVQGLYGLHDYDILFDEFQNIKIIHAPNGYGKTTLLKLISDIIHCRLFDISAIPFDFFMIEFSEDITIKVIKENALMSNKEEEPIIKYVIFKGEQIKEYRLTNRGSYSPMIEGRIPIQSIEKSFPFLKRVAQSAWYDARQNQRISYEEVVSAYGELLFIDEDLRKILDEVMNKMPIHFIHANRLTDFHELSEGRIVSRRKSVIPSVLAYSKELADIIENILARSAALTQELDRTFPARLIEEMAGQDQEDVTVEMIHKELAALERRRIKLEEIGLLSVKNIQNINEKTAIDKKTLKVLRLYIKDSKKKLDIFNEIETKVNLMREIINKRFNYKTMKINKQSGFVFELPNKTLLSPDKLSSGEQNELILIFELLFKSQMNSLILIDEPEISLHIAWQQQFLEDMQAISDVTDVKIIIATHSPDIINGRWDLTTGLEEC